VADALLVRAAAAATSSRATAHTLYRLDHEQLLFVPGVLPVFIQATTTPAEGVHLGGLREKGLSTARLGGERQGNPPRFFFFFVV